MSKIICDVCGTSYPETAAQCPICGCLRPGEPKVMAGDTENQQQKPASTYTYVKGGRFSKKNVRKRTKETYSYGSQPEKPSVDKNGAQKKSDKGLVIAVIVLLLAVLAVVAYIVLRLFGPVIFPGNNDGGNTTVNNNAGDSTSSIETSEMEDMDVPCEDIVISPNEIELAREGASWLLNVEVLPEDTTDTLVIFKSEDETIATVTGSGKVTAIAAGETYITVTCGEVTRKCLVKCTFEPEQPEKPVYPMDDFKLNRDDFTMNAEGQMHLLYRGEIPVKEITWTSDNEKVATIIDGVVTAIGPGTTEVHAEYNGVKLTCIVRCAFRANTGTAGNGGVTEVPDDEPVQSTPTGTYTMSYEDVTISVGEKITLVLKDSNGKAVNVDWRASDSCVTVNGNTVTGVSRSNYTKVYAAYDGKEYACIVRVKG